MKKHLVMLLITALLISFTACSSTDTGEVPSESDSGTIVKLSDLLNKTGVWVLCDTDDWLEEDTPIITVVEVKDGILTSYPMGDISIEGDILASTEKFTLGDLAGLSDKEILSIAKEKQAKAIDTALSEDSIKKTLDKWEKNFGFNDNQARYDAAVKGIQALKETDYYHEGNIQFTYPAKIALITETTDEGGKYTAQEAVGAFATTLDIDADWSKISDSVDHEIAIAYAEDALIGQDFVIEFDPRYMLYDEWIGPEGIGEEQDVVVGGFNCSGGEVARYLLRVCGDYDEFTLDEPDENIEGIAIDPDNLTEFMKNS